MKKRFTEEQIIGVLKAAEAGLKPQSCAASTASRKRHTTTGKRSSAGWRSPKRSAWKSWSRRTTSSSACWPNRCWTTRRS